MWVTDAANVIKLGDEILPGSAIQTEDEILNYNRVNEKKIWHLIQTCAMGRKGDPGAAVHSQGRAFGVQGLRCAMLVLYP
jgi:choline dehydrogenase